MRTTVMGWLDATWRVGRSVGRTVYVQVSPDPTKSDVLIGLMDEQEMAEHVVRSHELNRRFAKFRDELEQALDIAVEARANWRHEDTNVDPQYLEGYADGMEKMTQMLDEYLEAP